MIPFAVPIDGSGHDLSIIGGKGAALDRLVAAGFPVPPCAAVTTAAYTELARRPEIAGLVARIRSGEEVPADEVDDTFCAVTMPEHVRSELVEHVRRLGDRVALRSSATIEDLGSSSFAGQYRTLLDVDATDPEAVLRAVRLVWASLWHPAPCAYRRALHVDDSGASMAVVAMRMVPARLAGVVFTVDPGGASDSVRVEAVEGLGESLVSGAETPSAWVVDRSNRPPTLPPEVDEAVGLALEVEADSGCPQDVEWAADDAVWIVQARPITVRGEPDDDGFDSAVDDAELTTAGIGEMVPGVLPPLVWETNRFLLEEALRGTLSQLDAIPMAAEGDGPLVRRVRGRVALDFDQLRAAARLLPGGGDEQLEAQYFGSSPTPSSTMSSHHARGFTALVHDARVMIIRRQAIEDAEVLIEAADRIAEIESELTTGPADLLRRRLRLVDVVARGLAAELAVAAAAGASYHRVELLIAPHLGEDEAARWARDVVRTDVDRAVDAGASMAVIAGPTWEERGRRPPVISSVDTTALDGRRQALEELLRATPGWRTRRMLTGQIVDVRIHVLRRVIADAGHLLTLRERTKAALLRLGGVIRHIDVGLGDHLAERGVLDRAGDVELLSISELTAAVVDAEVPGGLGPRRRAFERCLAAPELPVRFRGRPVPKQVLPAAASHLDGWGASSGTWTGVARVLRSADDRLDPGEVLVARATDASWSPRFVDAGAVVVEVGGPLSHAAILARELGVPAVLNVASATDLLDGRMVTVDGDAGRVIVHDETAVRR